MNRTTWVDGTIFFLLGALCVWEGHRLAVTADPRTMQQALPPGAYIFGLGVLLILIAAVHVYSYRHEVARIVPLTPELRFLIATIAVLMAGYALALYLVGYVLASILFFAAAFVIFGVKSWLTTTILTVVFVAVCYLVFVKLCGVDFPAGVLLNWG
ncbi:MAG TPA: tripartite tricarboxylate transporter TctB family protein [Bauldia sp.]|nr:tripartite tricarboxylate transporter TctB family protein [Bauldia sp.]